MLQNKKDLISSIPKKAHKSHVKYFFSQVSAAFLLWFFSYLSFYSIKAPVLDSLSVSQCCQNEHKLISFSSATDSHCYLTSLDLFPSTSKYQLLSLSSASEVSPICSKLPKALILFIFHMLHISVLLATAAHPPGHCLTPSWAFILHNKIHNPSSWRGCCFLRACPKQSNLGKQLEGHPKEKSFVSCFGCVLLSSYLFHIHLKLLHQVVMLTSIHPNNHLSSFFFLFFAVLKNTIAFFHNSFTTLPHDFPLNSFCKLLVYCAAKKLLGFCQVLRKNLIVIYCYSAKKYYFIFPLCSPICLTVWLYLLCLSVAFRAHMQVFSVRVCTIFSADTYPPAEKPDPRKCWASSRTWCLAKDFCSFFLCFFSIFSWRFLGFCFFPLCCFLLNSIFFLCISLRMALNNSDGYQSSSW